MRPLNLDNVKATYDGDFTTLPAGAYVCQITGITDQEDKEYIDVVFDIIMGEYEGYFSDDFYKDKPWAHHMILSYKEKALGMLKGRLEVISACNTGFDAVAAVNAGHYEMLNGKVVGVLMRAEEYYDKKSDEFKLGSPRAYRFCTTQDIQDGKNANPEPKMLDHAGKVSALNRAGIYDAESWLEDREKADATPVSTVDASDIDTPF